MKKVLPGLFLRVGLGSLFLWTGVGKVFMGSVSPFFPEVLKRYPIIPFDASTFTLVVGCIQIVIGALLILGLMTRLFSFFAAIVLLVSIVMIGLSAGLDVLWNYGIFFIFSCGLIFLGGGSLSIDSAIMGDDE
jgi:uncharacterized membrane protein YphA (DoxX/SURF4 family)